MALKDQVVELVLRARNLLSGDTEKAAQSVESLTGSAEDLQQQLRDLEDQAGLIKQFDAASKAVDRTGAAYDRAQIRLDKLKSRLGDTGPLTESQQREFTAASRAVDRASTAYEDAQASLKTLSSEAEKAGIDVTNLSDAKRENAKQATAAARAIEDYNEEVSQGDGRIRQLGKSLLTGAAAMAKWAAAAAAAGAALAATAITRLTTNQADLARQTLASADAFGVSAVALQKWQYAAEQVGIGGEKTADILKDVSEKIGDAFATGGGEAAEVIDRLNLSVEDLVRLSPDQQILKISERLTGMPKAEQIQVLESLASDASLLLPLLDNNAQKLRELAAAAEQRGDILTEEELQRLAAFDAAFERMKTAISGVFKQIAVNLAPAFQKLAEQIDRAIGSQPELIERVSAKLAALVGRVTELATTWASSTGSMEQSFRPLVSTLEGTRQLFLVLVSAVQVVGATIAEVVARANYDWKNLSVGVAEALNAIGLGSDEAVLKARLLRDVAAESVRELDEQADKYVDNMKNAASAAASAFSDARDSAKKTGAAFDGVAEAAGAAVEKAGQSVTEATDTAATGITNVAVRAKEGVATVAEQAQSSLKSALDELGVDIEKISSATDSVEKDATLSFAKVVAAVQQTGASAEQQGATIAAAFRAAFSAVEDAAGRTAAIDSFRAAAESGAVSLDTFNETIQNTVFGMDEISTRDQAGKTVTNLTQALDSGVIAPEEYGNALQRLSGITQSLSADGDAAGGSVGSLKGQIRGASLATREVTDETGKWWKQVVTVNDKTKAVVDQTEQAGEAAGSAGQAIAAAFNGWMNRLSALSKNAAAAFSAAVTGSRGAVDELTAGLERANAYLQYTKSVVSSNPISSMLGDWARAAFSTEKSFYQQAIAARDMQRAVESGALTVAQLDRAARDANSSFHLLDANQLSGLRSAIASARAEIDSLNDSIEDSLASARQELAALRGDTAEVERLRYQEKQIELEEQLRKAEKLGDKEAIDNVKELIRLNEQAYQIKERNAREADARERQRAAEEAARQEQERQRNETEERQDLARQSAADRARSLALPTTSARTVNVNILLGGVRYGTVEGLDESQARELTSILERIQLNTAG